MTGLSAVGCVKGHDVAVFKPPLGDDPLSGQVVRHKRMDRHDSAEGFVSASILDVNHSILEPHDARLFDENNQVIHATAPSTGCLPRPGTTVGPNKSSPTNCTITNTRTVLLFGSRVRAHRSANHAGVPALLLAEP